MSDKLTPEEALADMLDKARLMDEEEVVSPTPSRICEWHEVFEDALAASRERERELMALFETIPALRHWIFENSVRRCLWCDAYDEEMGPEPLGHDDECPYASILRWAAPEPPGEEGT